MSELRKTELATTTTVTSNYAGKEAGAIVGAAFKEADTLRLGLVTVAENINYKLNLKKIAYADGTQAYSCGFSPAGSVTLSEKVLEPTKFKNDIQVCKDDFRQTWSEDSMGASASNPNAPADIMEAIQVEMLSAQAEKLDADIWQGNAADADEFAGFIELFTADGDIIKDGNGVTGPGHSVSESTVIADVKLALAAIPVALRRVDLVVAVSPDVFQAYNFKMISLGQANDGTSEPKQAKFGKYTLTEVNGLPDDTIVCYKKDNLVFGTGLQGDHNSIAFSDEDEIGLQSGMIRGQIVYNAGVNYYNSAEIVWLLLTT